MEKLNKVCTNFEQDFTETEKAQARRNIGAQQELIQGSNIEIVDNMISAIVPTPEPQPIPPINDAQLTINRNGTTVGTFTANASAPSVVDITVPTKTSDITNDSGFITITDLPTVNNGTLTIQKNGATVDTFTANSSSNKTVNITVPTKTSDLTNDSGFITSSALPTVNDGTLTIQKNGTTIDTFTANSSANKTVNIAVPTKTSDLTNDSGFITSSALPTVNDGTLTIQKNGTTIDTFTANSSSNKTVNIDVPEYTAGDDIKISQQCVVSSLHGLKRYTRTQPTGGYGDMSEDPLVSGVYHIEPPHMVDSRRLNNVVYEYTVTDITDCMWIDLNALSAPDSDGFVANMHYVIDLTGEITDNSGSSVPHKDNPYGRLSLSVGTSDPKDSFSGVYGNYIPISLGNKYLVDVYGNFVHISVLNRNRVQNIADSFGDVQKILSTTPQSTSYTLDYSFEPNKAYHISLYTNAMSAESTDKFMYRVAIGGAQGAQNSRYLTGWNRVDSGKSIAIQLDFVSPSTGIVMWLEFDRDNYPMATQSVNLTIMGTKEDFT